MIKLSLKHCSYVREADTSEDWSPQHEQRDMAISIVGWTMPHFWWQIMSASEAEWIDGKNWGSKLNWFWLLWLWRLKEAADDEVIDGLDNFRGLKFLVCLTSWLFWCRRNPQAAAITNTETAVDMPRTIIGNGNENDELSTISAPEKHNLKYCYTTTTNVSNNYSWQTLVVIL